MLLCCPSVVADKTALCVEELIGTDNGGGIMVWENQAKLSLDG